MNIGKYFQITVMTYGPVILGVVTKRCDFCPIHSDNAAPSRRLKCALQHTCMASMCVYKTGRNKTECLGFERHKINAILFFFKVQIIHS